jgi:integrase/recombinase XerC
MSELISAFVQHLTARRSARTARTYETVASAALRFFEIRGNEDEPEPADVEAFLARAARSGHRRAAATRNQELAALRALAAFAVERGSWPMNPTAGVAFAREAPRDPAVLSAPELRRFFLAAAGEARPWRRARNLAMLAVLSQAGLRVHELVGLELEQIDVASATFIAVRGKGGTVHDVPMNAPTLRLLHAWIAERERLASPDAGPLFVSARGSRLSARSVQRLVERLCVAVGTKKQVTPHTLRHTTATLALAMGSDLSTVGDLLRHTDLNTTRRYIHLVDERRREAVRRLETTIPSGVIPLAPPQRPKAGVGSCAHRSAKNAEVAGSSVDVQYGLDDIAA